MRGKETTSIASFSADGSLLWLYCSEARYGKVLDPATGEVLRIIEKRIGDCRPYEGTRGLTSKNDILDLATGELTEGFSSWRWWRAAGLD